MFLFLFSRTRRFLLERFELLGAPVEDVDINRPWAARAALVIETASGEQKANIDRIADDVIEQYLTGNLEYGQLYHARDNPDQFVVLLTDPERTQVETALMQDHFIELRDLVSPVPVVVVPVPFAVYTEEYRDNLMHMGFYTSPELMGTIADNPIRQAAKGAGLAFVTITEEFQAQDLESSFYFPYDWHFNQAGHRMYAKLLSEALYDSVQSSCEAVTSS